MDNGGAGGKASWPSSRALIIIALALAAGRIAVVASREGDTAFLSANDRSRWCTVAALVERGTYAIDAQINLTSVQNRRHRPWNTIDKVRHLGRDGQQHFYSSKPPLFPTLVAGVYWMVQMVSGMTLTDQPIYLTRIILGLVNLPMLALFFVATLKSIERICAAPAARQFCALCVCFGTMMLPFAISLNNHLPAAAATAAVMWIYLLAAERIKDQDRQGSVSAWFSLAAGAAAAMAAANELPALSMMVLWLLLFALLDRKSALPFVAGVAVIAAGFFGTNWLAHDSLRPPYAHRGNGALIADLSSSAAEPDAALQASVGRALSEGGLIADGSPIEIATSYEAQRWVVEAGQRRFALLPGQDGWQLTHWDDWYEYPGTYWRDGVRRGVDRGEPSRGVYLFHMLVGHHGIFSLTPIWLLVPIGLVISLGRSGGWRPGRADCRLLSLAIVTATVVCLLFYLGRPLIDRNYGGVSVCFRWLLWFAPLWLLAIAPVVERWVDRPSRRVVLQAMLALSVFSMSTALQSPWQSPWIYQFWRFLGWIGG